MANVDIPVGQGGTKRLEDQYDGTHGEVVSTGAAGRVRLVSATVTRPADTTAYAVGDLVANSTTAASVTAMTFTAVSRAASLGGKIVGARLAKSGTSVTNASFRLHLYTAPPIGSGSPASGDNGSWSTSGVANYVGAIDVTCDRAFTDGAFGRGGPVIGNFLDFVGATSALYGLLEARAAYTPASGETFTVTLAVLPD